MEIPVNEVQFSKLSVIDPVGRVFIYGNQLYRGIYKPYKEHVFQLLKCGLLDELIKEGMFPETTVTDLHLEGFAMVVKHEMLFVSFPHEWTPFMLREAALLTYKVNQVALKYGYVLKDAHCNNVLFRGVAPCFIDLGSFAPANQYTFPVHEFLNAYIIPLSLYDDNNSYLAHKLLLDSYSPKARLLLHPIPESLLKYTHPFYDASFYIKGKIFYLRELSTTQFTLASRFINFCNRFKLLRGRCKVLLTANTLNRIKRFNFSASGNEWANYQMQHASSQQFELTARFNKILSLVNEFKDASSALDIAGNQGLIPYSLYTKTHIKKITHVDYDLNALNWASKFYNAKSIPVNVIATNFLELMRDEKMIAGLKSDVVFGLAITHHLILSQDISIYSIVKAFRNLSNKYVVIEFMPLGLYSDQSSHTPPVPEWYTTEWFASEFEKYFEIIVKEQIEKNRILFVGKTKK